MFDKITFENENLASYVIGSVSVIKLKQSVFNEVVDFVNSERFFHILSDINNFKEIEALMIINEDETLGYDEYEKFIRANVVGNRESRSEIRFKSEKVTINRVREINVLKRVILKFVDFNKIIFSCLRGGIVTPFFGLSLASNFRFATEEMSYMLAHRKFGLHPTGALPFFLKHYVSWSKQNEILYQLEDIKAAEAKALGMIDKIFPDEDFEARCLDEVNRIVELNRGSACQTRLLMGFPISDLINYFDREGLFI